MAEPILKFNQAVLNLSDQHGNWIRNVSMAVEAGKAAAVNVALTGDIHESQFDYFPLADAAQGLMSAHHGEVFFKGKEWRHMQPLEQARNRGCIGRLFDFHGWVYNLSVLENLVLSSRMHGRGAAEPEAEAASLAGAFGMSVPDTRPVFLRRNEQRVFEWVRALMGRPDLLIMERPEFDMPAGQWDAAIGLVNQAMARGAAVLWIVSSDSVIGRIGNVDAVYAVRGGQWHQEGFKR